MSHIHLLTSKQNKRKPILDKNEVERYFEEGDIVLSGGQRSTFKITKITDINIRIKPTAAKSKPNLRYDKLQVINKFFDNVDPNKIEKTVGNILQENDLFESQTESYLYGFIVEYKKRKTEQIITKKEYDRSFVERLYQSAHDTREQRLDRLSKAQKKPQTSIVRTKYFIRNTDVITEVLLRANGKCEHCGMPAPFMRAKDSTPYLEIHHTIPLSDNGDDTIENAVALCPNCHRMFHFGQKNNVVTIDS